MMHIAIKMKIEEKSIFNIGDICAVKEANYHSFSDRSEVFVRKIHFIKITGAYSYECTSIHDKYHTQYIRESDLTKK